MAINSGNNLNSMSYDNLKGNLVTIILRIGLDWLVRPVKLGTGHLANLVILKKQVF